MRADNHSTFQLIRNINLPLEIDYIIFRFNHISYRASYRTWSSIILDSRIGDKRFHSDTATIYVGLLINLESPVNVECEVIEAR